VNKCPWIRSYQFHRLTNEDADEPLGSAQIQSFILTIKKSFSFNKTTKKKNEIWKKKKIFRMVGVWQSKRIKPLSLCRHIIRSSIDLPVCRKRRSSKSKKNKKSAGIAEMRMDSLIKVFHTLHFSFLHKIIIIRHES